MAEGKWKWDPPKMGCWLWKEREKGWKHRKEEGEGDVWIFFVVFCLFVWE